MSENNFLINDFDIDNFLSKHYEKKDFDNFKKENESMYENVMDGKIKKNNGFKKEKNSSLLLTNNGEESKNIDKKRKRNEHNNNSKNKNNINISNIKIEEILKNEYNIEFEYVSKYAFDAIEDLNNKKNIQMIPKGRYRCLFPKNIVSKINVKKKNTNKKKIKSNAKNIDDKPKKPKTPLFQFMVKCRQKIMQQHPEIKPGPELVKFMSKKWNTMSEESRAPFIKMYEKEKEKYMTEIKK